MSDTIYRQAAIDGTKELTRWYLETYHEKRPTEQGIINMLNDLPSAYPTQSNDSKALNALDCISRQAAIDEIEYELKMINSALDSITLDFNARERLRQRRGEAREILNSIQQLPSAQPERELELDGTESNIEILSELRSMFNCFDEAEEPVYRALSDAIYALSSQPEQNNLMADAHKRLMDETGGKAVCKNEHWGRGDNNDE